MAIVGLVLGWIGVAFLVAFIVLVVVSTGEFTVETGN
jgi:hypothetical protein